MLQECRTTAPGAPSLGTVHTPSPRATRTPLALGALVATLALVAPLTTSPATAEDPDAPIGSPDRALTATVLTPDGVEVAADSDLPQEQPRGPRVPSRWLHSSDGVPGPVARTLPPSRRGVGRTTVPRRVAVSPGVSVTEWDEATKRGPVRMQLVTANLRTPGLAVDYLDAGAVSRTVPLRTMVAGRKPVVAAVNGDFFDIGDTGAPLGIGAGRDRGLRHAPVDGWNAAFFLTRSGRYEVDTLPLLTRVVERPAWRISHLNSPEVRPGGIGVYTRAWGSTAGARWVGGQKRDVRMVVVEKGRVVANRAGIPAGQPIRGTVYVGRGEGARQLAKARKGQRLTLRRWLEGKPRMAITGNKILLRDGLVEVVDDREMHPRTAVGFDRDTRSLLLLVVDGRSSVSRGYTMVELAQKMIDLGAEDALNLDGGGSSTMLARGPRGGLRTVNTPSDGAQRSVPNGLQLTYRAPR